MGGYVGAIDQGTTSTRFLIFDRKGTIVGSAQKEHEQIYPKPGWVEHNAVEIGATRSRPWRTPLPPQGCPPPILSASASPINARRRSFGTAAPESRFATQSCGRTRARTGS